MKSDKKKHDQQRGRPAVTPDPATAIAAADAFLSMSRGFVSKVAGRTFENAYQLQGEDIGAMIASATTLTLAIELYLKTLCIVTVRPVPREHNLAVLYGQLQPELRRSLEEAYNAVPPLPDGIGVEMTVFIATAPQELPAETPTKVDKPKDRSLSATLERSRDAFVTWRYVHEAASPGQPTTISYDYHCLGLAAAVLRAHALELLAIARQRGRSRHTARGPRELEPEKSSSPAAWSAIPAGVPQGRSR